MSEVKTIEQLACDAGWIETTLGECQKGDEILNLSSGMSGTVVKCEEYVSDAVAPDGTPVWAYNSAKVLRSPRPEPEYEPGTVVWGKASHCDNPQAFIWRRHKLFPWAGVYTRVAVAEESVTGWRHDDIEVLRILAYPDGTTPEPGPVTDEQLLAALNAAEERRGGKQWSSLGDFPPEIVEDRRYALEAARLTPVKAEEITLEMIRETGKTAVDESGIPWRWDSSRQGFFYGSQYLTLARERSLVVATRPGFFTHWADEQEDDA